MSPTGKSAEAALLLRLLAYSLYSPIIAAGGEKALKNAAASKNILVVVNLE